MSSATAPASKLIVHADDLGETAEITRGILECIDAGRVTSTTLMANMPATDLAIEEAARRGRRASFGVHLVLCEGPPLTKPRSLVGDDGEFLPKKKLGLRGLAGRLDPEDLEIELRAQIRRIVDGGVDVSHFDSHKHLHQLPVVRGVVAKLAKEFGVERVRCTLEEGFWPAGTKPGGWASRAVRVHLARQAGRSSAPPACVTRRASSTCGSSSRSRPRRGARRCSGGRARSPRWSAIRARTRPTWKSRGAARGSPSSSSSSPTRSPR